MGRWLSGAKLQRDPVEKEKWILLPGDGTTVKMFIESGRETMEQSAWYALAGAYNACPAPQRPRGQARICFLILSKGRRNSGWMEVWRPRKGLKLAGSTKWPSPRGSQLNCLVRSMFKGGD